MTIRSMTFLPVVLSTLLAVTACQTTNDAANRAAAGPELTVAQLRATLQDRTFACESTKGFKFQIEFGDTSGDVIDFTYTNGRTGKSNAEAYLVSGETIRIKRDGKKRQFFDLGDGAMRIMGSRSPFDCTPMV